MATLETTDPAGTSATVAETIICQLAELIADGDLIHIGVTTPLGYVAAALAKATHAPDASLYALNISGYTAKPFPLTVSMIEAMALHYGPRVRITDMYTHLERIEGVNFEPVIPVQMDRYGNANLSQITDGDRVRVRLPGVGGLDVMGVMITPKVPFYTVRHTKRTFVDKVDFVTVAGTRVNGMRRSEFNPGSEGGPGLLLTNLGIFDFEGEDGCMRVRSLHEGASAEQVKENTSFPVEGIDARDVPVTPKPTEAQLRLIREALDPLGMRELEALSESDRRVALRELLRREQEMIASDALGNGHVRRRVLSVLAARGGGA